MLQLADVMKRRAAAVSTPVQPRGGGWHPLFSSSRRKRSYNGKTQNRVIGSLL
jgi:hypothetical protein